MLNYQLPIPHSLFPIFFLLCFVPTLHANTADFAYLPILLKKAQHLQLAEQREWHILLHYQPSGDGYVSEVDDPNFFNAYNGKTEPQAELEATLKAFFAPNFQQNEQRQHPQCAFIARYHWLKAQLNFDPMRLPPQPCSRFQEWFAQLKPAGLSLIFPAAYLNNPSSMFGHTLLRIDQANQDEQTRLLAYAINYTAATEEENGLVFAIKGLTGGYPGVFSILPYYEKVKEYNDLENRDTWEYQLNFTPDEIRRLLWHVWELDKIYFDYYFFDENCAYHLLTLLEAARPTLHLREQLLPWVIPGETVRVVVKTPGLLKKAVFRPASATVLRHHLSQLSPKQQDWVLALAKSQSQSATPKGKKAEKGKNPASKKEGTAETLNSENSGEILNSSALGTLDVATRSKILETAYDYLYYQHNKTEPSDRQSAQQLRQLLIARSQLPTKNLFSELKTPPRPDQGHASFRLSLGLGYDDKSVYQSLSLRPAYHDLLDPEAGYVQGAQINFLDLSLRHEMDSFKLKLEHLKVIDIISLTPRNRFFQPLSWKLNTGFVRRSLTEHKRPLVYRTQGGIGFSYQPTTDLLGYAFLETDLDIGGTLDENYALGIGGHVGLFLNMGPNWRGQMYALIQQFELGHTQTQHEFGLEQRFTLTQNNALRLRWRYHSFDGDDAFSQIEFSWHWYF
jgi:hypothetical protein